MGLFDKLFFKKPHDINEDKSLSVENHEASDLSITPSNNYKNKDSMSIPLWQSIPSDENREKDKLNGIDYKTVKIIFEDGNIVDVIPDVNNYYYATIYNIDGTDYDITNIESINSIPLPVQKSAPVSSLGTPVYRLEYLLRIHAGFEKEKDNTELAYALMHKGTSLLKYSNLDWQRHDYLREYYWLLDDDKIEDAQAFFKEIEPDLPSPYSSKEYTKEIQHYNYAVLKRNFPADMPKSFSAYMRNYNKQDAKFDKFKELAASINLTL